MRLVRSVLLVVAGIALTLLALDRFALSIFGSEDVEKERRDADVDIPIVIRVKGGLLEVASVKGVRHFSGATDPTIFGQTLPFCRETAGWNAQYKITYRVRLKEKWPIVYSKGEIVAQVPELEPSLPVAIDTRSLAATGLGKCFLMADLGTRDRVLRRISDDLQKLANRPATKRFARESSRRTIKEFLRTWAIKQDQYPEVPAGARLRVFFPGE